MYMIMQLRSGHVTLLRTKFQPLNCPPIGLTAPSPYLALPHISSLFFFQREISEVRGPICAKFCHMIGSMFNLQMLVQKFGGLPPKKIFGRGVKNTLNLAQFRTPSHSEPEYLQNGQRYPKSENYFINSISSRFRQRKFGELWSTNFRDLEV